MFDGFVNITEADQHTIEPSHLRERAARLACERRVSRAPQSGGGVSRGVLSSVSDDDAGGF
jgi:hypothetical protein